MEMNKINVEVAYATPSEQRIANLAVVHGTSIQQAIYASGLLQQFPEIDLRTMKVGIFGKVREITDEVKAGERIEIYRPLIIDPKEARRVKAKK